MNSSKSTLIIIAVLVVGGLIYWGSTNNKVGNPVTDVKTDTQVKATTVKVSTFYNGENGYSLSMPSGNSSTCIWNWTGGNAAIPYSRTTSANTATEKHVMSFGKAPNGDAVEISDVGYDFKVTCVDDFGNQYVGVFPTSTQ